MTRTATVAHTYPSEDALRKAAIEIARFACNGDEGRVLGDPVFEMVTEGRAKFKKYSGCGDLAHYLLAQLGVQDEKLVNRSTDGGDILWKVGVNLSRIVYGKGNPFVWAKPNLRPKPGDILYVSAPDHVCILEGFDETAKVASVFEYGQWNVKLQKPSGKRSVTKFSVGKSTMTLGSRTLKGWLDIARIPGLIATASEDDIPDLIA